MLLQVLQKPLKGSEQGMMQCPPFGVLKRTTWIRNKSEHEEAVGRLTASSRWSSPLQEEKPRHVLTGPKGWLGSCAGPCTPGSSGYKGEAPGSQGAWGERHTRKSEIAVSSQVPPHLALSLLNAMSTCFLTSSSRVFPTSGLVCVHCDVCISRRLETMLSNREMVK